MDIVLGFLSKLDWMTYLAAGISFIAGLAVIAPKLMKAVSIIGKVSELLGEISKSLSDGKLDKSELEDIVKDAQSLISEFKK